MDRKKKKKKNKIIDDTGFNDFWKRIRVAIMSDELIFTEILGKTLFEIFKTSSIFSTVEFIHWELEWENKTSMDGSRDISDAVTSALK